MGVIVLRRIISSIYNSHDIIMCRLSEDYIGDYIPKKANTVEKTQVIEDKQENDVTEAMIEAFYAWQAENADALRSGGYGNLSDLRDRLTAA